MSARAVRYRISILVFEKADHFWRAAHELVLHGFTTSQFCFLGNPGLFRGAEPLPLATQSSMSALDSLYGLATSRVKLTDTGIFEMRCGAFAKSLFAAIEPGLQAAEWIRPDLARSLSSEVAKGCSVLLVAALSADQHVVGAKLLLRHGSRDLQTHEFSAL